MNAGVLWRSFQVRRNCSHGSPGCGGLSLPSLFAHSGCAPFPKAKGTLVCSLLGLSYLSFSFPPILSLLLLL